MNRVEEIDRPYKNYSCDNLEDALKQMEGLMEETLKTSSKRRRQLSLVHHVNGSQNSENGTSEGDLSSPNHDFSPSELFETAKSRRNVASENMLDQFVSAHEDYFHSFNKPSICNGTDHDSIKNPSTGSKSPFNDNVFHISAVTGNDNKLNEDIMNTSVMNESHEIDKLEVMAENSNLKLKLAKVEQELKEKDGRLMDMEIRVTELQGLLNDRMIELSQLKHKMAKSNPSSPERSLSSSFRDRTFEREQTLERLKRKHIDVEKLKSAVETLMISNEEKNVRIEEMKTLLKKYRKLEDVVIQTQGYKVLEECGLDPKLSGVSASGDASEPQSVNEQNLAYPSATSTPVSSHMNGHHDSKSSSSTLPSPVRCSVKASSFNNIDPQMKTPPTVKKQLVSSSGFGTLPKDYQFYSNSGIVTPLQDLNSFPTRDKPPLPSCLSDARNGSGSGGMLCIGGGDDDDGGDDDGNLSRAHTVPRKQKLFVTEDSGHVGHTESKSSLVDHWSTSAPAIDGDPLKDELAQQYRAMQNQNQSCEHGKKKNSTGKSLKKLFHRLKRSNSQEFDDKIEDFKRSGLRSTAGPRLGGWNKGVENDLDIPFGRWDTDRVAMWLHMMGLSCYVGECKRWVKNGDHLLTATSHDLEKELGIKNAFHRKKLQLALQVITSDPRSPMSFLDHNWVAKWLDDIGLPQYKDQFSEARIDGRMINYLTNEDLMHLKVTSLLHHLSLKCGIQVLRKNVFNSSCLKRRPASDEGVLQNCPEEVSLWTNHRVMEWLRSIDLSEYAPNLRGSGVHGGLMVLEPRFSAEVLATILSIPSNKTLLRRHLTTHFVSLIGNNVQQQKRNLENDPNYIPLTTNQKVKPSKKIGLFRPRTADLKDDFVCPLDARSFPRKFDFISRPRDIIAKQSPIENLDRSKDNTQEEMSASNV